MGQDRGIEHRGWNGRRGANHNRFVVVQACLIGQGFARVEQHRLTKITSTVEALTQVLGHGLGDHAVELKRSGRVGLCARRRHGLMQHLVHDLLLRAGIGHVPGQQAIQQNARGKDVHSVVNVVTLVLLGCHEAMGANGGGDLCQPRIADACNAKVGDLELTATRQDQIGGFDVAVPNPLLVGIVQGRQEVVHDLDDHGFGQVWR